VPSARRQGRDVDAIVLLDKPFGMSSNQALQRVRRLFDARKAGHTGSLDPLATGMLPVCFGQATKLCGLLLGSSKEYEVEALLGVATDTGDAEGRVVAEAPVPVIAPERLEAALAGFRGAIRQVPPMYSALKHQGRRLYQLARAGQEVERPPRDVTIHRLEALAPATDGRLVLRVYCSKGTYIRTLVEDVAKALGTVAHVSRLHRTCVDPFGGLAMHSLDSLEAAGADRASWLLPVDRGLAALDAVAVSAEEARCLLQGRSVPVPPGTVGAGVLRAYAPDGMFLGLVQNEAGRLVPERMFPGLTPLPAAAGSAPPKALA
jgi:tRNA pseudouridine55 synthase